MTGSTLDADVVVAGAGLAGLAAAHFLARQGRSVVVFEVDRIGGRARSSLIDGVVVDLGAQFISDFYRTTLDLVDQVGLKDHLAVRSQKALIVRQMTPKPIWPLQDLLLGNSLSPLAKLRLLRLLPELALRWRDLDVADLQKGEKFDTESAAAALNRLCGAEDLEYFFAPLLRALLYWEADTTSMLTVFAILKAFVSSKHTYYMQHGIGALSDSLSAGLDVRKGMRVHEMHIETNQVRIRVGEGAESTEVLARGAICATPATAAAKIVQGLQSRAIDFLRSVSYTRTILVTYRIAADKSTYPEGAILFPVASVPDIASINPIYSSSDIIPSNNATTLIDVFLSSEGFERYGHLPDEELGNAVLARIPQIVGQCDWTRSAEVANVQRWPEALPRFTVGHVRRVQEFRDSQKGLRIGFAGDYLDGPYIDGALRSGHTAAEEMSRSLIR